MIKYYSPPIFIAFFLFSVSALAQHSVEGKVVDTAGKPVSFANVILLNAQDSTTVYKGAVTAEDGRFRLEEIEKNPYLLKVSFVGFEDFLRKIEVPANSKIPSAVLKETAASLNEVSINYKNPSIKREVDRLVFNVENTSLSSGQTWDILKKTPGVIVANDNLQVRNQGVQVYINDRKVQLSASDLKTLLENYSAENIKSIEVITTPPARYDAEGGAILNIVTSKAISTGYKGNVNMAYTQAIYPKYTFGTSHYHQTDKLNLFANYSYSPRKEFKEDESYINFKNEDGTMISRWETDFDRTTRSDAHNANLILDYDLNDKNILSFSSNFTLSPNKTFDNNVHTTITKMGQGNEQFSPDYFTTVSELEEDLMNLAFDLEYKHLFDKPGAQVSAKAHFTRYEQDRLQDVATSNYETGDIFINSNRFYTDAMQEINIFTGQVDYMTPLGQISFETGAKASIISSLSGIQFFDSTEEETVYNPQLSDQFTYDENIYAGYISLAREWEKWSVKAGLRGELTDRKGFSRSMQQEDSYDYFDLFPTFYLQHTISEDHSLSFDYSRRIQRPRYGSLNPFRYFLNEYDYNSGNPDLESAISDNFTLSYSLKNQYFFDLYYRDNGGYPHTLSFQDNDNFTLRRVAVNLLESTSYGLDISHGRSVANWWYASLYGSVFHEEQKFLALESNNAEVTNEIDAYYASLYNSFILSKDGTFSGELIFTHVSDWITGSYNLDPMTTLSIGFRKTLWDNRAEITLNLEDILDQTNTWMTSRYLNQDNGFFAKPESRYVRVGFKYNFGNFRLGDNQRAINAEERNRL